MSDARTTEFATEFVECVDRYLDQVEAAAAYAPMALDSYERDRTEFHRDVREVDSIESACDELLDELRSLVGASMRPNFTGVYFRPASVLDLFVAIDRVVNRIETFLTDLAGIEPSLSYDCRREFRETAAATAEATTLLATATRELIGTFCRGGEMPDVAAVVTEIGRLESRCDDRRTKIVADAFARQETATALVIRELATTLDAAIDAVEDAADRLSFLASTVVSLDGYEAVGDRPANGDRDAARHNR
jgi:uncharacterized protein Yka (UPF0111/DUF47 family)